MHAITAPLPEDTHHILATAAQRLTSTHNDCLTLTARLSASVVIAGRATTAYRSALDTGATLEDAVEAGVEATICNFSLLADRPSASAPELDIPTHLRSMDWLVVKRPLGFLTPRVLDGDTDYDIAYERVMELRASQEGARGTPAHYYLVRRQVPTQYRTLFPATWDLWHLSRVIMTAYLAGNSARRVVQGEDSGALVALDALDERLSPEGRPADVVDRRWRAFGAAAEVARVYHRNPANLGWIIPLR